MNLVLIILSSLVSHVASVGTSVITLLDDDMSGHPLCQAEDLLACQKAQVDVDGVLNNDPIIFPYELTLEKTMDYEDGSGTRVMELKTTEGNSSMALITITDEKIVTVSIDTSHGLDFNLLNCGPGFYLWRTVNETFYDHFDLNPKGLNQTDSNRKLDPALTQLMEESRQSSQQATITIKLYYTPALQDSQLNVRATLANNIARTNMIMRNTNIPLTIQGICPELIPVSEIGSAPAILNRTVLQFNNLDELYDGADLAMLVTLGCAFQRVCGMAATINVINPLYNYYGVPVRLAWTIALMNPFSVFTHELGHLLGGLHNRETINCRGNCPSTALGFLVQGLPYHTVMAYENSKHPFPIDYFSTPTLGYNDGANPIGTPVDDVRSTILSTRFPISRLGNDQCQRGCFNRDTWSTCWDWRQSGYCQHTYVSYMRANCALVCGFC
ncbi:hypothetical protein TCAL_08582 [Tigriopus californicus]|uniref:ShKT domain-containing protein n=1 Tax=Tigriopus californicus TaxID=6832 RepID=A0A553P654_TIGCA|nr:uncharacterized protein LOC131877670 [Tigriopus californicus]TRY73152.1 hypothetical protein TCAL_08582 [Tigriopus californicus]